MSVKNVNLPRVSYKPKTANKDVFVEVSIGDAGDVDGSYSVFLGVEFIAANTSAKIGNKANISGKVTTVSVTIVDELEETNWTSMKVLIHEGDETTTFGPYKEKVDSHKDTIVYILKIDHP
jgi:hypothetical protein